VILKGKLVAENTSLVVAPGSRQVLHMVAKSGALADLIAAGARILESACVRASASPVPLLGGYVARTINRKFEGRSGTKERRCFSRAWRPRSLSVTAGSPIRGRWEPHLRPDPPDSTSTTDDSGAASEERGRDPPRPEHQVAASLPSLAETVRGEFS
jgi:aconitate hydratase